MSHLPLRALRACLVAGLLVTVSAAGVTHGHSPVRSLQELVEQYTHGDADAAVAALAGWPAEQVRAAGIPPATIAGRDAARLALLHLEAGVARGTLGYFPHNAITPDVHGPIAMHLMSRVLATPGADAALATFVTRVLPLMPVVRLEELQWPHPDVAPLAAQVGRWHATRIGPWLPDERIVLGAREISAHGEFSRASAAEAERQFRRAISLDPHALEARVRLGRLHYLRDQSADAQTMFEAALAVPASAHDAWTSHEWHYLAHLFLGRLHEDAGRAEAATDSYRAALATYPGDVAAAALGRHLWASGHYTAGTQVLHSAPGEPGREPDPWYFFDATTFAWHQAERLTALRALLSPAQPPVPFTRAGSATAPVPPAPQLEPLAITAGSPVHIPVTVTDRGQPVTGLTAEQFRVTEGGASRGVTSVRPHEAISLALLVDVTPSVHGHGIEYRLLEAASAVASAMQPGDRVSVLTVGGGTHMVLRDATSPEAVGDALTRIADHIEARAAMLRPNFPYGLHRWFTSSVTDAVMIASGVAAAGPGRPLVVLLGDTRDNASFLWQSQPDYATWTRTQRARTFDVWTDVGVSIDTVWAPRNLAFHSDTVYGAARERRYSAGSGGVALYMGDPALSATVRDRFSALRQSYVLTYTPPGTSCPTGSWRTVTVRLSGASGTVTSPRRYRCP